VQDVAPIKSSFPRCHRTRLSRAPKSRQINVMEGFVYKTLVSIGRRALLLPSCDPQRSAHHASNVLIAKGKSSSNTGVYKLSEL
jgi:hypothetical protein